MAAKVIICLQIIRLENFFRKNFKGLIPHVCIKLSPWFIAISGAKSYQSRTSHVIELFAEAIAQAQAKKEIKLTFYRIFCSDYVVHYPALAWNILPGKNLAFSACKGTSEIQDFN